MDRRSVASLGAKPAAAVGGTSEGAGEGLRLTGRAGRVTCLAVASAPALSHILCCYSKGEGASQDSNTQGVWGLISL